MGQLSRLFRASVQGPPRKPTNRAQRPREYLLPAEVRALQQAAKRSGRYGDRDRTLILTMYRHGLRVGELVRLCWEQVHFDEARLFVRRLKGGKDAIHPLQGDELRALRRLKRHWRGPHVFVSERGAPLSESAVHKMIARAGMVAGLPFPVHPHMLRHATGYKLVNDGWDTWRIQDYLGHRNIHHTEKYTALDGTRFQGMTWDER
jgi:integrase